MEKKKVRKYKIKPLCVSEGKMKELTKLLRKKRNQRGPKLKHYSQRVRIDIGGFEHTRGR